MNQSTVARLKKNIRQLLDERAVEKEKLLAESRALLKEVRELSEPLTVDELLLRYKKNN